MNAFNLLLPYNDYSKGGRALAKALDIHLLRRGKALPKSFKEGQRVNMINWGSQTNKAGASWTILNQPKHIRICSNKFEFFAHVKEKVRIPDVTNDIDTARQWLEEGHEVMGRRYVGSCGQDICWSSDIERFCDSEFWSKYKKKESEYRIHIAFGEIISVQKKALRKEDPTTGEPIDPSTVDYRVRNHRNGFIFARHEITVPQDVFTQAEAAMATIGLDFGAVDVIWNNYEQKAYVLEINTAPGLEGTTLVDYTTAFKKKLGELNA